MISNLRKILASFGNENTNQVSAGALWCTAAKFGRQVQEGVPNSHWEAVISSHSRHKQAMIRH